MRLLIATGIYPPDIGGPATHAKMLVDELPIMGHEVVLVNFGIFRRFPKIIRHILFFFTVLRKGRTVDVLYALDPVSVGYPTALASKVLRKKFIVRIAGDYAWEQGTQRFGVQESLTTFSAKKRGYGLFVYLFKLIQAYVANRALRVIVPSQYLKGIVTNWGISQKKISVIHSSFEPLLHFPSKEVLRQLLGFEGKLIVTIGRLVPWKGYKALIELIPEILEHYRDVRLLIIGEGPERRKLEKLIKKHKVEESVSLVGSLDHVTTLRYLKAADLFILNTFYEGLSHVILEAMALEVPVITTSVGGNPELVKSKKTGLMVQYNNKVELKKAIDAVLEDPQFAKKMTQAAKRTISKFEKKRILKELVQELVT